MIECFTAPPQILTPTILRARPGFKNIFFIRANVGVGRIGWSTWRRGDFRLQNKEDSDHQFKRINDENYKTKMGGHGKDKDRRNSRQADFADEHEYAGTSSSHQVKQACTLHAEDLVPKFSGQDKTYSVVRWTQDIEDNFEIFQWTPLQTLIVARRSLIGTAALWLKSERPFKSWEDLKAALQKEFPDTKVHEWYATYKNGEHYKSKML